MPRSFREALTARPLLFEPVPPSARANPARSAALVQELGHALAAIARLDAIDVPELVDENHDGRPYYRSGDTRAFAQRVGAAAGREVILNKVVAHLPSLDAVRAWSKESVGRGMPHLVLVGGSSRYIPYPGPTVIEANRIVRPELDPRDGRLGNIAIPQRTGEAHRMLAKTRAGADFFTTQILFDGEAVLAMVTEFEMLCRRSGLPPAAVILSVAPIADEGDVEFVRWLGADLPEAAERSLLNGDESGASARSIERALDVVRFVRDGAARAGLTLPLGVNVEQISQRHLAAALEMLGSVAKLIDQPPAG